MEIGKSFSYPFEDSQWISKLGLGAVINLVPILNFAWIGYTVETMKNVIAGEPHPLPDWSDLGKKFMDGLFLAIAMLIYSLPGLLLLGLPIAFMVIPALFNNDSNMLNALTTVLTGVTCVLGCLVALYALVVSFFYPAVMLHFANKSTFGACFEVKAIFALVSSGFSDYLTAWAVWIGASLVIGIAFSMVSGILSLIPCVGWVVSLLGGLLVAVYTSTLEAHLFGQFARRNTLPQ
jgi:hypothetical protein